MVRTAMMSGAPSSIRSLSSTARRSLRWTVMPAFALVIALGCRGAPASTNDPAPTRGPVATGSMWITTGDGPERMTPQVVDASTDGSTASAAVAVDPSQRFQPILGFGAALTDATAIVLFRLSPDRRKALLAEMFSPRGGLGFSLIRIPLGASDYSTRQYSYDDVPRGDRDDAFAHFSIAPDTALRLPLLHQLRALNPSLRIFGAPWSAPAWMKSSQSLVQGTLRDDAVAAYAEYLTRIARAYSAAGVPLYAMSVQNEPAFEPADYPGMRLSAPLRAALVGRELGPRFASLPSAPMLLEWDHNWDHPEEPLGVLANESARRAVRGVAWHCYGGDVSAQDAVTRAYPTIETWFTECSGGDWAPKFGDNLLWNTEHLIIGTLTHGARGVMLWNLALDAQHGPHLGGCRDCRGVVTLENDGSVRRNVEYWVLAHAAKAFPPGSVRVALDALPVGIRGIAAMRPDGAVGMVLMNGAATAMTLPLSYGTNTHRVDLPPRSVATIVLP